MSRSTTYIGLPQCATEYLSENADFERLEYENSFKKICTSTNPISEKIGTTGMFDEVDIFKYKMKDGVWAEEYIQSDQWHGGPVVFMALKHKDKIFEWTDKEIEDLS